MSSSRIADILRSAQDLPEPIHVFGVTPAARALVAARFYEAKEKPLLILCATDEIASDFASDLECLGSAVENKAFSIAQFPTWEQSPFSPIAPSLKTRLARIASLSAISRGECQVVVTSIPALSQATLPPATFEKYTIHIECEKNIDSRESLISRLLEAGYLRSDPVEDPGTFAVRGEILDVFPPDRARPVRIELFDDLVERIREFDPASQRAFQAEGKLRISIPPAREVLVNSETAPLIRERLKNHADRLDIPRTIRDPVLSSIQSGTYADRSDAWAGFAYPQPATLWDYLGNRFQAIWNDELASNQRWDEYIEEQERLSADASQSQVIVPSPEDIFRWSGHLEEQVRSACRIHFDQLDLLETGKAQPEATEEPNETPALSARHRAIVRGNGDLTQGSRHSITELEPKLQLWRKQGFRVIALASTESQLERIRYLLQEREIPCQIGGAREPGLISLQEGRLSEGFRWPAEGLVILSESEILGSKHTARPKREKSAAAKDWSGLQALSDLSVGDAVVHVDHGIGRYQGLVRLDLSGAPSDFLLLEYANRDKLYLPVYRLNVIQKYVGSGESASLDRLGSQQFQKTKQKVREAVKKLAIDLIQLYAERKIRPGVPFSPRDSLFREFEAKFPFDETPDQLRAIDQVLSDLESGKVMDRLVCGDVGYGKTEVAIRAAFRAVSDGKQVAVLVPTTVLAYQHEQSFRARLKEYPIVIESLSRFKSAKEQKSAVEALAAGKVDIIIGTHRLLSRDVKFRDLGLVIVDEEHRFGVEHKEKLKTLKVNTHVLTLTATPIPRTLHMALAGLRDISLINTPPVNRLPIRTYVSKYDESLIQRAVEFELNRGGQVFFLHNRVQSIYSVANKVRELAPKALVGVAHGQMAEAELEKTMVSFYQKQINVLVCTSIIESGLDLPSANTIIIDRADALGLAQLYQIRGRVGRGQLRAYAYLLLPAEGAVTDEAKRRLEVIQRFVELGSGFSVASHDLEIRGGGDILGPQQSGHIAAVGFDLYTELLEEAIHELEGKPASEMAAQREPEIKAPFAAFLSEEYVPDVHQRLSLYRRFSAAAKDEEVTHLEEEMRDRFGALPEEAQNLLWLIRIKQLLKTAGVDGLTVGPERISLMPGPNSRLDPSRGIALVSSQPSKYQITPDSKFVVKNATPSLRDLFFSLESLFRNLGIYDSLSAERH